MKLDIFTLFPEAFEWFRTQRSVENAVRRAMRCGCSTTATRLRSAPGQVDDAPYGGGAGMVLRVDVVDAALGPPTRAGSGRGRVLLTPTGRLLDDGSPMS